MLKRCRSLDNCDVANENAPDHDEPLTQVSKKGKKGKGGKGCLTQTEMITDDHEIRAPTDSTSPFNTAPSELCVLCQSISTPDTSIQCDSCAHLYHLECCQVGVSDVATVRKIIDLLGWSCKACRLDMTRELQKLRNDIIHLQCKPVVAIQNKQTLVGTKSITTNNQTDQTDQNNLRQSPTVDNQQSTQVSYADVIKLVNKSVRESTTRKKNVIVTGLGEQDGWEDEELFSKFCEEQLGSKPRLSHLGAKRLGKEGGDRPRRLLVHLESEAAAAELLNNARYLRESDDDYVSKFIFINPDLTKEEAKHAYERRQARRCVARTDANNSTQRQSSKSTSRISSLTSYDINRPSSNAIRNPVIYNTKRRGNILTSNPANLITCTTTSIPQPTADRPTVIPAVQTSMIAGSSVGRQQIADMGSVLNPLAGSYQASLVVNTVTAD